MKKSMLLVALEYSAAVEIIEHFVLLTRLERSSRVQSVLITLIKSYLTDRMQFVRLGSSSSQLSHSANVGSHKGPCLGPWYLLHTSLPHPTLQCTSVQAITSMRMTLKCTLHYLQLISTQCLKPSKLSHNCTLMVQSEWSGYKS